MNPSTENLFAPDVEEPMPAESVAYDDAPEVGYRVLSPTAVAALAIGLLSPLVWFDLTLAILPFFGMFVSLLAIRRIRSSPDVLMGLGAAYVALILSAGCFAAGVGKHVYVYRTEVPEGYKRTLFEELQPDPNIVGQDYPPSALQLNGQQLFIKGYMKPGCALTGVTDFLFVGDRNECCMGGNPKPSSLVQIHMRDPDGIQFKDRVNMNLIGTFRVDPSKSRGVYYYLEGAEVR